RPSAARSATSRPAKTMNSNIVVPSDFLGLLHTRAVRGTYDVSGHISAICVARITRTSSVADVTPPPLRGHAVVEIRCAERTFNSAEANRCSPQARTPRWNRVQRQLEVTTLAALRVVKLSANIGARIEGVDLADGVDAATAAQINAALLEHKVIFF